MTMTLQNDEDPGIVPPWELCDRLRRSLRTCPLSNAEVAEIMGVNRGTVSQWLNGHNRPSHTALAFWADMTNVDLHWLKTGEVLRACRDSNPKPSDLESAVVLHLRSRRPAAVNSTFTLDRRVAS